MATCAEIGAETACWINRIHACNNEDTWLIFLLCWALWLKRLDADKYRTSWILPQNTSLRSNLDSAESPVDLLVAEKVSPKSHQNYAASRVILFLKYLGKPSEAFRAEKDRSKPQAGCTWVLSSYCETGRTNVGSPCPASAGCILFRINDLLLQLETITVSSKYLLDDHSARSAVFGNGFCMSHPAKTWVIRWFKQDSFCLVIVWARF